MLHTVIDAYLILLALLQGLIMVVFALSPLGFASSPSDKRFAAGLFSLFGSIALLHLITAFGILTDTSWSPLLAVGTNLLFAGFIAASLLIVRSVNWFQGAIIVVSVAAVALVLVEYSTQH